MQFRVMCFDADDADTDWLKISHIVIPSKCGKITSVSSLTIFSSTIISRHNFTRHRSGLTSNRYENTAVLRLQIGDLQIFYCIDLMYRVIVSRNQSGIDSTYRHVDISRYYYNLVIWKFRLASL